MPPLPPLFVLPVGTTGSIVCTSHSPKIYLLTFQSPPDNRLTAELLGAWMLALDIIELRLPKGVVITTSGIAKFYSNGLNLELASSTPGFWEKSLYPLWRRLLSYPMPTIAMINGHCFAGGLITAMMHDYRFMNPHKGFLCMNELDFGAPLKPPMSSIFRQKLPRPDVYRTMVLEAKRFNALQALDGGLVDGLGAWEEVQKFVEEMKLVGKADSGVYGALKEEMWRETIGYLDDGGKKEEEELSIRAANLGRRMEEANWRVTEYARNGKTKL